MKKYVVPAIFMAALTLGMLMIFLAPKESVSEEEKRALAQFPEFSAQSLADGSFTAGINEYLNDHFPLRRYFMDAGDRVKAALVRDGDFAIMANAVNGYMGAGEGLPEAAKIDLPEKEDYNSRGVIISGTRAMELFKYSENMIQRYASILNSMAQSVPDVDFYSMVIPTSVEFYSPLEYHQGMRSQKECFEQMQSRLVPSIKAVNAYPYIAAKADEYVYFRTDHHWTARGAYQGYYAFCKKAGLTAAPLVEPPINVLEGFTGTLYNAAKKQVLKENPDYVEVFAHPEAESCTAYTSADMKQSYGCAMLIDPGNSTNKYLTFLGGDNPLVHIVTGNKNGKRLLMIKDSFGNALTLFMANNYEELYVADCRSSQIVSLSQFCQEHQITDVLVENYAFGLAVGEILSGLEKMAD